MIVQLSPRYKFVCERCGKEQFPDKYNEIHGTHEIVFTERGLSRIRRTEGEVCEDCYNDFWEVADNFFHEVNREERNGGTE